MIKVIFDCERMKYEYTGLYYYCLNLSKAIINADDAAINLSLYLPSSRVEVFDKPVHVIRQNSLHKFLLPSLKDYNIWHCTYQGSNYFPFREHIKKIVTVHDLNFMYDENKSAVKKKKYLKQVERKIEAADHIIAISNFTLSDVKKYIDISNKPCSVIYNGSNIHKLPLLQTPVIKPAAKFLFTIGTITAKKNFQVLPCLLANNDMQLIIAGITQNESYKSKIEEEAKKWNVQSRLIFTGSISENDKQWYLKNCAAFVFPSISEGFGLPVIEAMVFGKPVFLSKATSLPEIGGNAAYYFSSFNASEMQQTLETGIHDYEMHPGKAALIEKHAQQFSWAKAAKQHLELYKSL